MHFCLWPFSHLLLLFAGLPTCVQGRVNIKDATVSSWTLWVLKDIYKIRITHTNGPFPHAVAVTHPCESGTICATACSRGNDLR